MDSVFHGAAVVMDPQGRHIGNWSPEGGWGDPTSHKKLGHDLDGLNPGDLTALETATPIAQPDPSGKKSPFGPTEKSDG